MSGQFYEKKRKVKTGIYLQLPYPTGSRKVGKKELKKTNDFVNCCGFFFSKFKRTIPFFNTVLYCGDEIYSKRVFCVDTCDLMKEFTIELWMAQLEGGCWLGPWPLTLAKYGAFAQARTARADIRLE